jgi:hypothetical protein
LFTIVAKLVSGALGALAPMFNAIADAIAGVVKWLNSIKWPTPPKWLTDLLGGGASALGFSAHSAVSSSFYAGPQLSPAVYARAGSSSSASTMATTPGASINITVNAPFGGGDAIARAIRSELVALTRRERGVIIGGTVSYP